MDADPEGFKLEEEDLAYWAYEYAYKDGRINVSSLVNDLEIPTIGVLNGPGFHTEICLMCDLTICGRGRDPLRSSLRHRLGARRRHPQLLPGTAGRQTRGLCAADRPGDRRQDGAGIRHDQRDRAARKAASSAPTRLADHIMTQPRTTRRLTTQIVRRPWRQRITNDLDGGFGIQMFAHLAKKRGGARPGPYRRDRRLCPEGQEEQFRLISRPINTGFAQREDNDASHHQADIQQGGPCGLDHARGAGDHRQGRRQADPHRLLHRPERQSRRRRQGAASPRSKCGATTSTAQAASSAARSNSSSMTTRARRATCRASTPS